MSTSTISPDVTCDPMLDSFRSSSHSINTMISFLKAGKVDLESEVHNAGAGLDLQLFAQCGFKINLSS